MAEFCRQCGTDLFGIGDDLAGITEPERYAAGEACVVICEGCGVIQVDPDGNCVSKDCLKKGHKDELANKPI